MFHFCNLAKAMSDENRVRILMALKKLPLCVCQLTALLDLAPSTTSKHLSILRQAQLIECVKHGRWVYYQLPKKTANTSISVALQWLQESLEGNTRVQEDHMRLADVLQREKGAKNNTENNEDVQYCEHSAYIHSLAEEIIHKDSHTEKKEER